MKDCPTCGGKKKDHSDFLWLAHKRMDEGRKETHKQVKKQQQKLKRNIK